MSIPQDLNQRRLQGLWCPTVIKALGLAPSPATSGEHQRMLRVATGEGMKLNGATASSWHTFAPSRECVLLVEANIAEEDAVHQAALVPQYVVLLPHVIAPARPCGPWFALCGTNWTAYAIRENLRGVRAWPL